MHTLHSSCLFQAVVRSDCQRLFLMFILPTKSWFFPSVNCFTVTSRKMCEISYFPSSNSSLQPLSNQVFVPHKGPSAVCATCCKVLLLDLKSLIPITEQPDQLRDAWAEGAALQQLKLVPGLPLLHRHLSSPHTLPQLLLCAKTATSLSP